MSSGCYGPSIQATRYLAGGGDGRTTDNNLPCPIDQACSTVPSGEIKLAVKMVSYTDPENVLSLTREEAEGDLVTINHLWSRCQISFGLEDYQEINPLAEGLLFQPDTFAELDRIRTRLADSRMLLVTATGDFNRTGSLGASPANAWTSLPYTAPFGSIVERNVATYPNLIAHELGHYLNLGHVADVADLMNPIVYETSENLSVRQCDAARYASQAFWAAMRR